MLDTASYFLIRIGNSQLDGYLLGSWKGMTRPGPRGRWDA
jgi:hypothetical protein